MRDDHLVSHFPEGAGPDTERLVLRLYVAAAAPNSKLAEANLRALLADAGADYTLDVVDCLSDPLRALRDGILVTPTLVKVLPHPQQTVIGTLRDSAKVASALGIDLPSRRSGTHD